MISLNDKIEKVRNTPLPETKSQPRFMALAGYYRQFWPHYTTVAALLNDLIKIKIKYVLSHLC